MRKIERAFNAYKAYLAVKLHFDSKSGYDMSCMTSIDNTSFSAFEKRSDRFKFLGIVDKVQAGKERDFFIANAVELHGLPWIGDLLDDSSNRNYDKWRSRTTSIPRRFESDAKRLVIDHGTDPMLWVTTPNHDTYPPLVRSAMDGDIDPETYCIVCAIMDVWVRLDEQAGESFFWPGWQYVMYRYRALMKFDLRPFAGVLRRAVKM